VIKTKINGNARSWLGLVSAIVLVTGLIFLLKPEADTQLRKIPPLRVVLTEVKLGDFITRERFAGRLTPRSSARLNFEVAGQVAERHAEPGESLEAGEPILSVEAGDYERLMIEAESKLQQEKAAIRRDRELLDLADKNVKLQKAEVGRLESLVKQNLSSRSQLDAAVQKQAQYQTEAANLRYFVETAEARLQSKQATFERARTNLERTTLKAPFSGRLNSVSVDVGDYVNSGQVAAEMIDNDQLELVLHVPGSVVSHARMGDMVEVELQGTRLEGLLLAIQSDPDPMTFTHELRIRLPAQQGRSGQIARAELVTGKFQQVYSVPVTAVLTLDGKRYIYAYSDGSINRRPVELLQRMDDHLLIASGVRAGEQIVARDVAALSDGISVAVVR
jgi:membrane fusion protein (multidrug efflux system)